MPIETRHCSHNSLDLALQLGKPWDRSQKPLDRVPSRPSANDQAGMAWWNNLRPFDRAYWLSEAGSAAPVDAWNAYQQKQRLLALQWGARHG